MKKILFIMRDGMDAEYIMSNLHFDINDYKVRFILETGAKARAKKLKRMFRRKRNFVFTFFDLVALYFYDRFETSKMRRCLNLAKKENEHVLITVEDVNDEDCRVVCEDYNPDMVFVYGTGILTSETIKHIGGEIYNIHSSILPYYRNVHSDFHAYMNEEYEKIGITILRLTEGIDSGEIAMQQVSGIKGGKLYEHKVANLKHIPELVGKFVEKKETEGVDFVEQDEFNSTKSHTPCFEEIIDFWIKQRRISDAK